MVINKKDIELPDGWSVASCWDEAMPAGDGKRYGIRVGVVKRTYAPCPMSPSNDDDIVWCVPTALKWNDYPLPDTVEACDPQWYADQMGRKFTVAWNHRAGAFSFLSSAEMAHGGGLRGQVTPVRPREESR